MRAIIKNSNIPDSRIVVISLPGGVTQEEVGFKVAPNKTGKAKTQPIIERKPPAIIFFKTIFLPFKVI